MKMLWFYGFLGIGLSLISISTANPKEACKLPAPIFVYPVKVTTTNGKSDDLSSLNPTTSEREKRLTYKVELNGVEHILQLRLNEELVGNGITLEEDDEATLLTPEMIDLKEYTGVGDLTAAFTIDEGLDGFFALSNDTVYLFPNRTGEEPNRHGAYFNSEIECDGLMSCGEDLMSAADLSAKVAEEIQLGDDENLNLGSPAGRRKRDINAKVKVLSLHYIMTRDLYFNQFNFNIFTALFATLQLTNQVDSLYQGLNIRVFSKSVTGWTVDPVPVNGSDAVSTVNGMERWTVLQIASENPNWVNRDHHVYLFDGTFIQPQGFLGIAYLKTMCTDRSVSYLGYSLNPIDVLIRPAVMTHEIGHSFGLLHNKEECECGAPTCIMDARASIPPATKWSDCSRAAFDILIRSKVGLCLLDDEVPSRNFRCGNNFLETGEECDCGSVEECTSLCCDPSTCKLREFAECDDNLFNGCCDSSTCRFALPGTLCRPPCTGNGGCDLPEYCTGSSAICPVDAVAEDGSLCSGGNDRCKSGYCLTKDRQCMLNHGPDASSASPLCYLLLGTDGDMLGNCGVALNGSYIPCAIEDVECGKLYCDRLGLGSASHVGRIYFYNSTIAGLCFFVVEPPIPGYMGDTTYIQDGSGCNGNTGTCTSGVCTNHTTDCLECPAAVGVCSSLAQCFCTNGMAPPLCDSPGASGSLASGPVPLANPDIGFCTGTPSDKWTSDAQIEADLQIEVSCTNKIVVSFNLCPFLVRGYKLEDLVIFNPGAEYDPLLNYTIATECVAVAQLAVPGFPWRARIELNSTECGGQSVHTATENGFLNQFRTIRDGFATGIAVRVRPQFVFNYTCKWINKLNGTISMQPDKNVAQGNELVRTNYIAALSWYYDSSFSEPIDNYIVKVGERIYAQLDLQAENDNLWLQVRDCWVSKYSERLLGEIRYTIISGGCPTTDVLGKPDANQIIEGCSSKQSRFSFLALAWTDEDWAEQNLFLHCNVAVCDQSLNSCACPACVPTSMRKKRNDASENIKVVGVGPLRIE